MSWEKSGTPTSKVAIFSNHAGLNVGAPELKQRVLENGYF